MNLAGWHRGAPRCGGVAAAALLLSLFVGCSPHDPAGTVPVRGQVTYRGQPVEGATVTFADPDGKRTPGADITDAAGGYRLAVKPGNYTVLVSKFQAAPNTQAVSMEQAAGGNTSADQPKNVLPDKYNELDASPLTCEVKSGGEIAFEVELLD